MSTQKTIIPVILCGGAGSRLWPMSRADKPKQFHALFNADSLLANTLERVKESGDADISFSRPMILGSASLAALLEKEAAPYHAELVLEPSVRDTAAAIAACTAHVSAGEPDAVLLVLPSDAQISDIEGFRKTVIDAARIAFDSDAIMTIGIEPTRPETQYGYIERGDALGAGHHVRQFREKPDSATAQDYVASGNFVWNAGMFMFRAGRMAREFETLQPEIWEKASAAVSKAQRKGIAISLDTDSFNAAPKLSIDYAIMEKADNIGVVGASFDWDDLGSWSQLHDNAGKDEDDNAVAGDAILIEASGNYVRSDGPTVALAGVEGLAVVAEDNKVLVCPLSKSALVKDVTTAWKEAFASGAPKALNAQTVRSWLYDTCLPFWVEKGVDRTFGGVHEALNFDGTPADHSKKRLRVLPRQIYCFAHAVHSGFAMPEADIRALFDTLVTTGWHEKEGGFIHLWNPDGTIQDETRDTYDQCFVLLACAWLIRAYGWKEARDLADRLLGWMDDNLADPVHGGYFENNLKSGKRRANPHMHFFEAMLALYEATGERDYLDRAEKIARLFEDKFFDPATGTLTEFFNEDWSRIEGDTTPVEPGHHYEWAWLILRYLDKRDHPGMEAKARALYSHAKAFGHHPATGAAADTIMADGTGIAPRARTWPQTEALKAAIAFEKRGLSGAAQDRDKALDVLFKYYLDRPIAGGWYDAIDANGRVVAPDMPSSTFYHVFCAMVEYLENV